MYAPGNEHLAAIDAEQGEFPELATAQDLRHHNTICTKPVARSSLLMS